MGHLLEAKKRKSLKQKLILRNVWTLSLVIAAVMAVFFWLNHQNYRTQLEKTKQRLLKSLEDKGRLLAVNNALTLKVYVEDRSYNTIGEVIETNVVQDSDLIYGGYIRPDFQGVISRRDADGKVAPYRHEEPEENALTTWALGLDEFDKFIPRDNPDIFYIAAPLYVDIEDYDSPDGATKKEKEGAIIYGFSDKSVKEDFDRERIRYNEDRRTSLLILFSLGLLALFMGVILTQRQAATITQPLGILTSAVNTIATGNYSIEVEVSSGDEIEMLAASFNQMVKDLEHSYDDLSMKNKELEAARNELEDLNRHLEEKVEERTKQLRESESKFRTLFEESADAILLATEREFLDCNPAMLDMMGCERKEDFLALDIGDISPERQPNGRSSSELLHHYYDLARREGSQQFEWLNRKVDGSVFYSEIVITSFPLNDEQVLHQVFRDITERKKTEDELRLTQQKLVETAHSAGMAEIATGVLHNIGNILNSVNISTEEISATLKGSKLKGFIKANEMVAAHAENLGEFFTTHPKGKLIPGYFQSLAEAIGDEHEVMNEEINALADKVSMMRDVISTQQSYAKATLYTEDVPIVELVEDALKLQIASLKKQGVRIHRHYQIEPVGNVPKVKLVHVLTNLFKNGKEAMSRNDEKNMPQDMDITIRQPDASTVEVLVSDNGCGIVQENLDKIFNHGFTTKSDGHGFGLHTCANFMTEMGGSLTADSMGEDKGATFIVRFPLICKGPVQKQS